MKTKYKNRPSRSHRDYNCGACDICTAIRSLGGESPEQDSGDLQSIMELLDSDGGRSKEEPDIQNVGHSNLGSVIIVGEIIPLKFFAAWMVKNIPANVYQEILSVICTACQKNFRDYLVAGKIGCGDCDSSFAPFIKAVLKLMGKHNNQG